MHRAAFGAAAAALALTLTLLLAACTQAPGAPAAPSSPAPTSTTPASRPAAASSPAPAAGASPAAAAPAATCQQTTALTVAQTEGPYFKAGAPQRTSLIEQGMAGTRLVLTGQVMTPICTPLVGARLDFWQADDQGRYDNAGYKLRGYVVTDEQGRYRMETIVPGLYPGRTRHIHVKVQPSGQQTLTTQLYFPDEPRNQSDGLFHRDLVMQVRDTGSGNEGMFDFVLWGS